jgi:hypothetical protein
MKDLRQVMAALEKAGDPRRVQAFANHGAPPDRMFGVSVADMKIVAKAIKGRQDLAYELFETGNGDAQYLAGMVADGALKSKGRLDGWARGAVWQMVSESTVPWVATESDHAHSRALKWMRAKKESVASSGWNTYSGHVTVTDDEALELAERTARRIGAVEVELGGTSCKVPLATEKIAKARRSGRAGKKRRSIKC